MVNGAKVLLACISVLSFSLVVPGCRKADDSLEGSGAIQSDKIENVSEMSTTKKTSLGNPQKTDKVVNKGTQETITVTSNSEVDSLDPKLATERAPERYAVRLVTTKGNIEIELHREWAPKGVDRFYNLVKMGYYTDVAFFRVIAGFMAQVGLSGNPKVNTVWRSARIQDDTPKESNTRGMVTFATSGKNSRTTQFFINFKNNARLDGMGFTPIGKVREASLSVLDSLYSGYGEGAPRGRGPNQGRIHREGNAYLKADFPELDYIKKAELID